MNQLDTSFLRQLESRINAAEAAIAELISGTEKTIIWAADYQQTEYAVVYIHGFSASRQEIAPVCDSIAAELGANLFYTRLCGHGSTAEAMADISAECLIQDALEALTIGQQLGRKLIVVANSTGASLACRVLADDNALPVAALIMLSPNFGLKSPLARVLNWPGKQLWLRLIQGQHYTFTPQNDAQAQFWTTRFPSRALIPMTTTIARARSARLEQIHTPSLMLYCTQDKILDTQAMLTHFARIGATHKQSLAYTSVGSTQQHILAGDILSPQTTDSVTRDILEFVRKLI